MSEEKNAGMRGSLIKILGLVLIIFMVAATVLSVRHSRKEKEANRTTGCSFSTEGFENVTDAECLKETFAVFTDTTGKKGIMSLDGKVLEEASQDKIYAVSDEWRNYRYVALGPLSEYPLIVDTESGTVTSRQYHGPTTPERTPCWNSTGKYVAWTDKKGFHNEISSSELQLDEGLYPIGSSLVGSAKFGFVNDRLQLDIALIYDAAGDFSEGLAPVRKEGNWGYIDEEGKTVIPFCLGSSSPDGAYTFRNGLVPVCKEGKYGIVNRIGDTVVGFDFERILQGKDGKYIAKRSGKWGVLTVNSDIFNAENTTEATEESTSEAVTGGNFRVRTSGSSLNLRATADKTSAILAAIPNGTVITVTKSIPGWAYTVYNSASGWVSADYIVEIETDPAPTEETTEQ